MTNTHELQDAALGVVRRPRPAISGGYDLFVQLPAEQRQFVAEQRDQQRRRAQALLTPPDHR